MKGYNMNADTLFNKLNIDKSDNGIRYFDEEYLDGLIDETYLDITDIIAVNSRQDKSKKDIDLLLQSLLNKFRY
tara:strand:+ start:1748 stop:1969 length:222 start_codon:yes stop_codon:yes gene_type:complete